MTAASDTFESALAAEGVTGQLAQLARSIHMQESGGGRNTKTSNQGARGGMQIIPSTFASVADKGWNIDDPLDNARAGIRYLKQLDKLSGGNPSLTAAGYYGGPGGMQKAKKGVAVSDPLNPQAPNTLQYADQVVARMGQGSQVVSPENGASAAAPPAPVQVAQSSGMVELPPELLAHRTAAAPAIAAPEADAWGAFLKSMPATRRPVQVAELANYGAPQVRLQAPPPVAAPRPIDFRAFGAWKGRVA